MPRNIVFIILDSVRKDYFEKHAPLTKEVADVTVDNCRAASNWSPASHAAIITGTLPHASGIHGESPSYSDTPIEDTFFDTFSDYYRWAVSSNVFISRAYDFQRYFDNFTSVSRHSIFPVVG